MQIKLMLKIVIIIGEDEFKNSKVSYKNLETGEQFLLLVKKNYLKKLKMNKNLQIKLKKYLKPIYEFKNNCHHQI